MRLSCCYKNQITGDTIAGITIGTFINSIIMRYFCFLLVLFLVPLIFCLSFSFFLLTYIVNEVSSLVFSRVKKRVE